MLVCVGSVAGLVRQVVDQLRDQGVPCGMVRLRYLRPFPAQRLNQLLAGKAAVGVLEKDISFGAEGTVFTNVNSALAQGGNGAPTMNFIGGLGGDDITAAQIRNAFARLAALAEGDQRAKGAPAAGSQWAEAAAGKASASAPDPVPTGIRRAEILSLPQRVADGYPRPGQPGATSSAHSSNCVVFLGVDDEGEVA